MGFLQDLAIVILAPNRIKKERVCECLGILGIEWLSSAMWGLGVTVMFVKVLIIRKFFCQKALMWGQVHQILSIVPSSSQLLKLMGMSQDKSLLIWRAHNTTWSKPLD